MPVSPKEASEDYKNEPLLVWLPDEIWLKIFSFFESSPRELTSFSSVCKRWNTLCFDPSLWRRLNLANWNILPGRLSSILQRIPCLQNLSLRNHDELTVSGVAIFAQHMQNVVELDLGFSNVNAVMIRLILCHCRKLEKLNVEGARDFQDDALEMLLSAHSRVSALNFSHCGLRDESVRDLVKTLPQIVSLNIDGISWITDETVQTLVQCHAGWLVELHLDGAELTDKSAAAVSQCSCLTLLSISFCELLSDLTLRHIKTLQNLEHLRLKRGTEFSTSEMISLFQPGAFPKLHHLDLSECSQLNDDCLQTITACIGTTVTSLLLSWCWFITDRGLVAIVDNCKHLKTLDIVGLDKVHGDCFDRLPEEIPSLCFLNLQQCNRINDSLIIDVIREKPNLRVVNYYGEEFIHGNCESEVSEET